MVRPSAWPDWLDEIWAKSPAREGEAGESLAAHTWEVLTRLRDQAALRPWLPALCGFPELWNVLFWSSLLHDWGKVAGGFQGMVHGRGRWPHRHEVLSVVFLEWITPALSEEASLAVAATILSHHRDAGELEQSYPVGLPPEEDPISALSHELDEATVRGLWRWLADVTPDWARELRFEELDVRIPRFVDAEVAVRLVLGEGRDRIRRCLRQYYRLVRTIRDGECASPDPFACIFLRGGLLQADHAGSAHIGSLPLPLLSEQAVLTASQLAPDTLHEHQRKAGETCGSAILVAPTGSGKTEAALLWAAGQNRPERQVPRLFYTLPYQASMNAMYDRLNRTFPGQVGLIHSRSVLALYQRLMEQEYSPGEAARQARLARNMAALHYYPIRVFSPYQMLKAAYQLKGYEAMLSDFAGGAFIFDEIHAYEPRRLALILEMVRYLRERFDARFFVMSATLPSPVRERLEEALGQPTQIAASDHLFRAFTRHRVHVVPGNLLSNEGVAGVRKAFEQGESVLVTCNTVARAQEFYQRLKTGVPGQSLILIHGRFNGRDRLAKEREVNESTGLRSRSRRPVVVVATQVVEVSLNIDLDVLFSDPAPLEALIQRFGRINRGRRPQLARLYVFSELSDAEGIYLPELVAGALRAFRGNADGQPINEGLVQRWLDQIYSGEIAQAWREEYDRAAAEFRQVFLDNLWPFGSGSELEEAFEKLFDGTEVLPACLREEYTSLREDQPIEAAQLLVPVSWSRWRQFHKAGKVRSAPGQWPRVVDVPYSAEVGLAV